MRCLTQVHLPGSAFMLDPSPGTSQPSMPLEEAQYLPGQEQEDKAGAGGTPH